MSVIRRLIVLLLLAAPALASDTVASGLTSSTRDWRDTADSAHQDRRMRKAPKSVKVDLDYVESTSEDHRLSDPKTQRKALEEIAHFLEAPR
ncbi:MAG: hypothetical protein AAGF72_17140, partial [Pseudomonadota bacterium]